MIKITSAMNHCKVSVRLAKTLALLLCLGFSALGSFVIASTEESIPQYEVTITLQEDGSFEVKEVIYYDFARNVRHGITRDIPVVHQQPSSAFYKKRYTDINVQSILMDDEPVPYEETDRGDELFLKIGDPYKTILAEHKYTINYTVTGGLHYFDDLNPELYWDAIGTQWQVPIGRGMVTIIDEAGVTTGTASCYVGTEGTDATCGEAKRGTTTYQYTVADVGFRQGISVALALNHDVPVVIKEKFNYWYFVVPVVVLFVSIFGITLYRYKTAFKIHRPVVAQYEPYQDLKPMYLGVLYDDMLQPADITACIVYLAEQGYLRIKKTTQKVLFFFEVDDYEVTLVRVPDETVSLFQNDVLELLFKNQTAGSSVTLSKLKTDIAKQRENQRILRRLKESIRSDLVKAGYFQDLSWAEARPYLGAAIAVSTVILFLFPPAAIFIVILGIIFILVSRRRTRKGYEALNHLKGFKLFLETTEKDRYKFHNAPSKSPEQFMQFLPFAVAFGVEKEWAEVFKDISIPDPEWYDGGSVGSFQATNLTTSLGAFSTAFASSSGSSSGSSGGGSVGGGGGGGGGGSW